MATGKGQKDTHTKRHTQNNSDYATWTPIKTQMLSVTLVTNPVIVIHWTYPWSCDTHIFPNG